MEKHELNNLQKALIKLETYAKESYPQFHQGIAVRTGSLVDYLDKIKETPPTKKEKNPEKTSPVNRKNPEANSDTIEA